MSTLTFTFIESNREIIIENWIYIETAGGGLKAGGVLASSVDLSYKRLCQRRHRSWSWRSKSIHEQIIILPLTSVDRVLRKRSILKKSDISRN